MGSQDYENSQFFLFIKVREVQNVILMTQHGENKRIVKKKAALLFWKEAKALNNGKVSLRLNMVLRSDSQFLKSKLKKCIKHLS